MSWLSKLEYKYGKYSIRNLTLYLIICYAFGYVIFLVNEDFLNFLSLNPYAILHGQVWRIVTWIVIPPERLDIFTLVMLYFYYSIGTTLERTWGTFRYNVYLFSGLIFTVIGAFLFYLVCLLVGFEPAAAIAGQQMSLYAGQTISVGAIYSKLFTGFSTYYVCMSIILGFATTFPDVKVLFMFFIPIKIKVLGIIYGVILGFEFLTDFISIFQSGNVIVGCQSAASCAAILFSLLNFIIFFVTTRKSFRTPNQIKRQRVYKKQMVDIRKVTKHKCAICGRTEDEYPDLQFRFCSKCNGNYEYCEDHLFTHTHVK